MNNINKASKDIKKKLSLNDYSKPVKQQDNKDTNKQNSEPLTKEPTATKNLHQVTKETPHCSGKSTCRHVDTTSKELKVKATYYLNMEANRMFTDVYINRLKNNQKIDRSTLICEAIKYLYKNEF